MIIAYWIVAGILALAYLFSGVTKLVRSKAHLEASGQRWVAGARPSFIKFVGVVEILGALGVILPPAFSVLVILAPLAAIGLVLVQAVAIGVHMQIRDVKTLPVNIVLLILAFATAWLAVLALILF